MTRKLSDVIDYSSSRRRIRIRTELENRKVGFGYFGVLLAEFVSLTGREITDDVPLLAVEYFCTPTLRTIFLQIH